MMDRYLLRYFLAIVDAGNFSKAAAQCNVSQPTLSVGIAKLERELGRPLFHRTNRRVELTAAGARFAPHARRIEAEYALAKHAVQETEPSTPLRLGVLTTIPGAWIELFVSRLSAEAESPPVELVEGRERDLIERLARARIDVALTIVRPEGDRFAAEILFREGYSIAMSSRHPFADRAIIAAEELADNPMIVRRQCELLSETSRHFTARGVRPFFPARTLSDDHALRCVRAGLGVTIMPDCYRSEGIVRPKLADFTYSRAIGFLFGHHIDRSQLRRSSILSVLANTIRP